MGRTKRRNTERYTKRNTKRSVKRNTKRSVKRNTKRIVKRNTKRRNTKGRNTKRNINRYTKRRNKMGGASAGFTVMAEPPLSPTEGVKPELDAIKQEFNAVFDSDELISDIYKLLKLNNFSDENILEQIRIIVNFMIILKEFLLNKNIWKEFPPLWITSTEQRNVRQDFLRYLSELIKASNSIVKLKEYNIHKLFMLLGKIAADYNVSATWYEEYDNRLADQSNKFNESILELKGMWKKYRGRGFFKDKKKLTELREAS